MKRRWVKVVLLVSASVLSVLVIAFFVIVPREFYNSPYNDKGFDRGIWLSAARNDDMRNPRGPMAEDLRRHYLRNGMTREQVRRLLGKPDNSEYDEQQGKVDHYFLGAWGFISIDGDLFIVHYDKSGRLISTEIYSH